MARKQVIVQLDDELVKSLDRAATKVGINRSELLRQAAFMWLQVVAEEELDRMHAEAYRRIPQGTEWDDRISEWDPARKRSS
jgi:metal-responsive CopG/Arc/MetJ family transcriptional regulator